MNNFQEDGERMRNPVFEDLVFPVELFVFSRFGHVRQIRHEVGPSNRIFNNFSTQIQPVKVSSTYSEENIYKIVCNVSI